MGFATQYVDPPVCNSSIVGSTSASRCPISGPHYDRGGRRERKCALREAASGSKHL